MLAVGDKVFKQGVIDFLNQRAMSHALAPLLRALGTCKYVIKAPK